MYQAEIIMGVLSDHAYGDKHGPIFLIKKKCKEKRRRRRRRRIKVTFAEKVVFIR